MVFFCCAPLHQLKLNGMRPRSLAPISPIPFAMSVEAGRWPVWTLNVDVGRRYREAILEAGGSRSAMENFKAFRGREPQIDALLRHQGMS